MSRSILCFALLLLALPPLQAKDWPQWMGPGRDNVWKAEGLLTKFPAGGPKVVWRAKVAGGYAGPAVVGDRVYVTDYTTSENVKVDNFARKDFTGIEKVMCLDATSGNEVWSHEYPVTYGISYPAGPRCTPTVDGDMVYALGAEGHLIAFKSATGDVVWSKDLKSEYGTKAALWGYAAHPLIDGDRLITLAGGQGSHVVALNKLTGDEIWRSQTQKEQGYVPPSIIEQGGKRQLLIVGPEGLGGLNPETGESYWSQPYDCDNGSVIMTPRRSGDYLFLGGYNNRSLMMEYLKDKPGVKKLWQDKQKHGLSAINVQPFAVGNVLYGMDQSGEMLAVEYPSGKRLWSSLKPIGNERSQNSGTAMIVQQADRFWLFNESGELIIAKLSPEKYEEIDRAKVIKATNFCFGREVVWCAPAFANKRMYVRNDEECICVELSK